MKVTMHGAGQEVGRSCIEVEWYDKRILLDGGIKIGPDSNEFPTLISNPHKIDALFLSHAHLDHTGSLPFLFHQGVQCPIFTTALTKDLTKILLKDSWKIDRIEQRKRIYDKSCIANVLSHMRCSSSGVYKGIKYEFFIAGHIPGAMSILLTYKGERLLYSGDINGIRTHIVPPYVKMPKSDVLIIESTYGNRYHIPRATTKKNFKEIVQATIQRGGSVLVAAFAVGRSQEMLYLLNELNLRCPIYLDGMSRTVTQTFLRHPKVIDTQTLRQVLKGVIMVKGPKARDAITKRQSVIVATSGMLDGGPILGYIKDIGKQTDSSLILTGYQGDQTNGRLLLNQGYIMVDNKPMDISCAVHHLDFSGHAGEPDLHRYIDMVRPSIVITNHGEPGSAKSLAAYARSQGCRSESPATGESISFDVRGGSDD